ncbi:MAG: DUF6677 family protein [Acidobacteriota bacterium]
MQSKEELTDNLAAKYAQLTADEAPKVYPASKRTLALVVAWLIPGAGHLVLGKYGRAAMFFLTITAAFMIGLALHGRLFWPLQPTVENSSSPDFVSFLWFFAQIGTGLCYLFCYALGINTIPTPNAPTYEYANALTCLAGLLNYLVIHDVFDIAAGRKK